MSMKLKAIIGLIVLAATLMVSTCNLLEKSNKTICMNFIEIDHIVNVSTSNMTANEGG